MIIRSTKKTHAVANNSAQHIVKPIENVLKSFVASSAVASTATWSDYYIMTESLAIVRLDIMIW